MAELRSFLLAMDAVIEQFGVMEEFDSAEYHRQTDELRGIHGKGLSSAEITQRVNETKGWFAMNYTFPQTQSVTAG